MHIPPVSDRQHSHRFDVLVRSAIPCLQVQQLAVLVPPRLGRAPAPTGLAPGGPVGRRKSPYNVRLSRVARGQACTETRPERGGQGSVRTHNTKMSKMINACVWYTQIGRNMPSRARHVRPYGSMKKTQTYFERLRRKKRATRELRFFRGVLAVAFPTIKRPQLIGQRFKPLPRGGARSGGNDRAGGPFLRCVRR